MKEEMRKLGRKPNYMTVPAALRELEKNFLQSRRDRKHSLEAVALVKEFVTRLEEIQDACAERFPFETIDEMKREYLGFE